MNIYWLKKIRKRFDIRANNHDDRDYLVIDHLKKNSFNIDLDRVFFSRHAWNCGRIKFKTIYQYLLREYLVTVSRYQTHEADKINRDRLRQYKKSCREAGVQPRCNNHDER